MPVNTGSSAALSATMQSYYDRKMILNMKPKLVYYQYGQKRILPRNSGKTVQFRKWTPFAPIDTPLQEGTIPDGQNLSMTSITTTAEQYGGYVAVSDILDMTALDPVVNDSVELMADQAAVSIDRLTRAAMASGTNVIYSGSATSRETIAGTSRFSSTELRKAVRLLKKNHAPRYIRGDKSFYVCIVGPDGYYDLQTDSTWIDVSKYQEGEQIFAGEIGRLFGVVIVEAPESLTFPCGTSLALTGASSFVFGKDAFGVVELEGGNARTIVKNRGSAGTSDPLDQISTVGWKVDGYAAQILQNGWLVRVDHYITP